MLDIEVVTQPTDVGTDILSVASLKSRLKITHTRQDDLLEECINEAAAELHGPDGELRRTLFPTTYRRWMSAFPSLRNDRGDIIGVGRGVIPMPFPPLVEVLDIAIEDGSSPTESVDPADYVVRTGTPVGEIVPAAGMAWPSVSGPRSIAITYRAGYVNGYPPMLKRLVALKAAHNYLNPSASIQEPRVLMINRRTEFGVSELRQKLQVRLEYGDWGEDQ